MTVNNTGQRFTYAGNDSTTVFSFPRQFLENDDLLVILKNDTSGAEVEQSLSTQYTVTGAGNPAGGDVTFVTPPATGETVVLTRRTDLLQSVDYSTGGNFAADTFETNLDKLTLISQDQQEELGRAIKFSDGSTESDQAAPESVPEGYWRWNAAGTALEAVAIAVGPAGVFTVSADNRLVRSDGVGGNQQDSGIVVDDSDNVSGVVDLTITGDLTLSSTRPSFSARKTTAQTINSGTPVTLIFNVEDLDRGSDYDNTTGIFTAPVAGDYQFNITVTNDNTATVGDRFTLSLVTTARTYTKRIRIDSVQEVGQQLSIMVAMSASDTAEVQMTRVSGTGAFVILVDGTSHWFTGRLV